MKRGVFATSEGWVCDYDGRPEVVLLNGEDVAPIEDVPSRHYETPRTPGNQSAGALGFASLPEEAKVSLLPEGRALGDMDSSAVKSSRFSDVSTSRWGGSGRPRN